jgi:hypothetical protein
MSRSQRFTVAFYRDGKRGILWTPLSSDNSSEPLKWWRGSAVRGVIKVKQSPCMMELRSFANQWELNIEHQGFMEVFQRQYGGQNGATTEGTVTR